VGEDVLKKYPEKQVHGWYERLARKVNARSKSQGVSNPMSGTFLLQYIGKNNNPLGAPLEFDAPDHLKADDSVTDVLAFHRAVFLTEKKGSFSPAPERWVGIIPRLQSGKWDGTSTLGLEYTSLSDVAPSRLAIGQLFVTRPPKKWDIFTSLRGWQLKSSVQVTGTPKGALLEVSFSQWTASGEDLYDFDRNEHLTLPNPDYQSKESFAIAPTEQDITVYHSNAFRLERAGLARPFKVKIRPWLVLDPKLRSAATVDPKKKLP
jgi:hypothetical protein